MRTTERTLVALAFPAVVERLAALTATAMGRERALATRPYASRLRVERELDKTGEALALAREGSPLSFEDVLDVRLSVGRARRGGTLDGPELVALARTARQADRLGRRIRKARETVPRLADVAEGLGDHGALAAAVERALTPEGDVRDDASPELASQRRALRQANERLRERLEVLVRDPSLAPFLQDPIVTRRAGRWVVPVKIEHRAQVAGVVHDVSSSGATVFVEPLAVLGLANEVRQLEALAAEEEQKVLRDLSRRVAAEAVALERTLAALGELDLVAARAELARRMEAARPEGLAGDEVELRAARHPLLPGEVVPIDLELGGETRALVVTGPNTGGKTVSLKTLGLLALMAQSGLFIPAAPGSRLPVFPGVFCDAGDEQDVRQNLSTFSSHVGHVVEILAAATPGSLVLLDEVGAGTDPDEGAALAMAILRAFVARGALVVATTHYAELKAFAQREPGVRNASVEFDPDTLQPTFRLVLGVPGRSHAFAIARRLGLPEEVLADARRRQTDERREAEELLEELARLRDEALQEREAAAAARAEAERLEKELRSELLDVRRRRAELAQAAQREAERWQRRAEAELEALVRRAREALEEAAALAREAEEGEALRDADDALRRTVRALRRAAAETATRLADEWGGGRWDEGRDRASAEAGGGDDGPRPALRPGAHVVVKSLRLRGEVVERGPEGEVVVRIGVMRMTVPEADLEPVQAASAPAPRRSAPPPPAVGPSLDLHGLRVEEALAAVDRYLDDAVRAGWREVRIVHGRGTGALRDAVRRFLAGHPQVAAWRPGLPSEGGPGTTVCTLR
ncbi:MAG: Smr/MutS family protein [Clostridia bacterium]|nr:Smr/MutS family protein [Clostridia bacterium]